MQERIFTAEYKSPIGNIKITTDDKNVIAVQFSEKAEVSKTLPPIAIECVNQLDEYFNGKRKVFDLKLAAEGTPFRKQVWDSLLSVGYGKTASYKDIAVMIDNPKAVRAVGGANNKNPIAIIIPCHRIIGADGSLVGYGGGIERKKWLLEHEQRYKTKMSF